MINVNPLRDMNDELPVAYDADGNEIYRNECTYPWEGRSVCRETFVAAVAKLLREDPGQVAREMGLEPTRYD